MAKTLFQKNRFFYYITLIIWVWTCSWGILCALRLTGDRFYDISSYVKTTFSEKMSVWAFIKLGLLENVRFLIVLIISSSAPILLPLIFALTAFKGFAVGFTSAIIIRIYAIKGALVCLGTVVLPYSFSMPFVFMMTVYACAFSYKKRKSASLGYGYDKSKEWFSYIAVQLCLTAILCVILVLNSFLSKLLTPLIN